MKICRKAPQKPSSNYNVSTGLWIGIILSDKSLSTVGDIDPIQSAQQGTEFTEQSENPAYFRTSTPVTL